MSKKNNTTKVKDDTKEVIINKEVANLLNKQIIIKSIDIDDEEAHIIILKDGSKQISQHEPDKHIIIGITEGCNVNWTQITTMINCIKTLKDLGATNIKRYDELNPGEVNPLFNLSHALLKYNLR